MEKYISYLKRNNYSQNTINTYNSILLSYAEVMHDIRMLKNKLKICSTNPNTIRTHYSVLHAFLKFKKDKRLRNLEEFNLPHSPNIYRPVFTKEYLYDRASGKSQKELIIKFLFETGLRVSELKSIISITSETITLVGKGNKIREVFHNIETTKLITSFNFSSKTIRNWVKDVLGKEYSPHSIRRSHATHLLLGGANPKMVMLQLGHSKVETTYRYLQSSKELNQSIYTKYF